MEIKGIDLSVWQKKLKDPEILRRAGIRFAILKLSEGSGLRDAAFEQHLKTCGQADVSTGAYVYSHSRDAEGGRREAEFALSCLGETKPALPLFIDIEGDILSASGEALTQSALAFGERVREAGLRPGIYSSAWYLRELIDTDRLRDEGFAVWCAAWNGAGPGMDCDIWQSSCSGRLEGYEGAVDTDVMLTDLLSSPAPAETEDRGRDRITLRRGMSGMEVMALQCLLTARGCPCGPWGTDGVFGPDTETALRRFQAGRGLTEDGVCGGRSWEALLEVR